MVPWKRACSFLRRFSGQILRPPIAFASDVVRVIINDKPVECQPGSSILMALHKGGIQVPTLCHDGRLQPTGSCRSCLISLRDRNRLVPACATPVEDGIVIETHTPELGVSAIAPEDAGAAVSGDRLHPICGQGIPSGAPGVRSRGRV